MNLQRGKNKIQSGDQKQNPAPKKNSLPLTPTDI